MLLLSGRIAALRLRLTAFPIHVGRYLEGQGQVDRRDHVSLTFQARVVCTACNNGWMSRLESEAERVLRPLTEPEFPILADAHLEQLKGHGELLARWLAKTALTTSYALPGKNLRLGTSLARPIAEGRPPRGVWLDVARSTVGGVAALLTKTFMTVNGWRLVGAQTHQSALTFQFCLQINHLLLRIGMCPEAVVEQVAPGGLRAYRLYPNPDVSVPETFQFGNVNEFLHSIRLRTWLGCPGEIAASRYEIVKA